MADNREQQTGNKVSLDEYRDSMPWRAPAAVIDEAAHDPDTESVHHFVLRLLDNDELAATDRLVEVLDESALDQSAELKAHFLVSVVEEALGSLEAHPISDDGLIFDNGSLGPNGYFILADGIDPDEFRNVSRVLLQPRAAVVQELIAMPLPE